MRKTILFLLFVMAIGITASAQKDMIVFYNDSAKQAIKIKKNGMVMLKYKGYLNQTELTTNYMIQLNDSSLVLAQPRVFKAAADQRTIMIGDITGFRKVSAGSQLLKTALTLGVTLGTFFAISNNDAFTNTQQIIYSTAAGLATSYGIKLAFPMNKTKYDMRNGWKIMVR